MNTRSLGILVALLAFAAAAPAHAGDMVSKQSQMDAEVNALLGEMRASGCRFNRNGSWYDAADASGSMS